MSKYDHPNWNHIFPTYQTQVMHFLSLIGIKQDEYKKNILL
jgi:hypothetical protein